MKNFLQFWEKVEWYDVKVLNEREVRAWAWILFLFAVPIFMYSCSSFNFFLTKIFIVFFLIDFWIRVFINPKFSPSLILWRIAVKNQKPEYSWAPQKKFAWMLWFILAFVMFITMVIFNIFVLINFFICTLCLILLFFESSFWICIWCKMYDFFNKNKKAQLCPWWVCEISKKEEIQKVSKIQILILIISLWFLWFLFTLEVFSKQVIFVHDLKDKETELINSEEFKIDDLGNIKEDSWSCIFPDWVKDVTWGKSPCWG